MSPPSITIPLAPSPSQGCVPVREPGLELCWCCPGPGHPQQPLCDSGLFAEQRAASQTRQ